jgi:hypothetical protein
MYKSLKEISQITIYLKEKDRVTERIHEVALFRPLDKKSTLGEEGKHLDQRSWTSYHNNVAMIQKIRIKVQTFLFQRFKHFIPPERRTPEAKFKTAVAILLSQEGLRDFFLNNERRRLNFLQSLYKASREFDYHTFETKSFIDLTPHEFTIEITRLPGKKLSLIEDSEELHLQMASLSLSERNQILFAILNEVERPPLTSVIEIFDDHQFSKNCEITTRYAKTKIIKIDAKTRNVEVYRKENQATSSIKTVHNIKPGVKGVTNQRMALDTSDTENPIVIGTYSGELITPYHVLFPFFLGMSGQKL